SGWSSTGTSRRSGSTESSARVRSTSGRCIASPATRSARWLKLSIAPEEFQCVVSFGSETKPEDAISAFVHAINDVSGERLAFQKARILQRHEREPLRA